MLKLSIRQRFDSALPNPWRVLHQEMNMKYPVRSKMMMILPERRSKNDSLRRQGFAQSEKVRYFETELMQSIEYF